MLKVKLYVRSFVKFFFEMSDLRKEVCLSFFLNPFVLNASFLYPLKTSEYRKVL